LKTNDFGDTTFMGYRRMQKVKEAEDLLEKVLKNDEILRGGLWR
jgi:hypothetical protein